MKKGIFVFHLLIMPFFPLSALIWQLKVSALTEG